MEKLHFNWCEVDAMRSSSGEDRHIDLRRPHTVLILSTIRGGYARRGAYTNAIAQQFMTADGKTSIHDIHCRAVLTMWEKDPGVRQTPEFRSTQRKRLLNDHTGDNFKDVVSYCKHVGVRFFPP